MLRARPTIHGKATAGTATTTAAHGVAMHGAQLTVHGAHHTTDGSALVIVIDSARGDHMTLAKHFGSNFKTLEGAAFNLKRHVMFIIRKFYRV